VIVAGIYRVLTMEEDHFAVSLGWDDRGTIQRFRSATKNWGGHRPFGRKIHRQELCSNDGDCCSNKFVCDDWCSNHCCNKVCLAWTGILNCLTSSTRTNCKKSFILLRDNDKRCSHNKYSYYFHSRRFSFLFLYRLLYDLACITTACAKQPRLYFRIPQ